MSLKSTMRRLFGATPLEARTAAAAPPAADAPASTRASAYPVGQPRDVLTGVGVAYAASTFAWIDEQIALADAEAAACTVRASDFLAAGMRSRRLAVDLRLWRDRESARVGSEPPQRIGDDLLYTHWSGGSQLWPLCGEQFAARQSAVEADVTCPECRESLKRQAAEQPAVGTPAPAEATGAEPSTAVQPVPLTTDDYWDYGQALGLSLAGTEQARAEADPVDEQPLYGGHAPAADPDQAPTELIPLSRPGPWLSSPAGRHAAPTRPPLNAAALNDTLSQVMDGGTVYSESGTVYAEGGAAR